MRGVFETGGLAPYGKIGFANFSYPRWACEITVDTAFEFWRPVVTYFSMRPPCAKTQATV